MRSRSTNILRIIWLDKSSLFLQNVINVYYAIYEASLLVDKFPRVKPETKKKQEFDAPVKQPRNIENRCYDARKYQF